LESTPFLFISCFLVANATAKIRIAIKLLQSRDMCARKIADDTVPHRPFMTPSYDVVLSYDFSRIAAASAAYLTENLGS
jgi:hypothetical protein